MNLRDRIVQGGQRQTTSVYTPNQVYARGTDHTSLGLGEPGAINDSGMPYARGSYTGNYGSPRQIPLVRIGIVDGGVSYDDSRPLVDALGLVMPEDRPGSGTWAQLYRAGRLYG